MHRRHFLQLSLFAALSGVLPGLTGCARPSPLRVGLHPWIGYETLHLAREFGWLADSLELIDSRAAADSMARLQAGELDAAGLTLDEALRVHASGTPLRAVAVTDVSAGADVVLARPEIASLSDIAGRRVAVELGGVSGVMFFALLKRAGLDSTEVSVVDLPVSEHLKAWNQSLIDVSVSYQPMAARLAQAGAVPIFDSRQLPDTIFDLLVVTQRAERERPEAVGALVRGHFDGLYHLIRNRHDAVYRIATHQKVAPESVRQAMATVMLPDIIANRRYLAHGGRVDVVAGELVDTLMHEGLMSERPDLSNFCQRRYLPEVSA